MIIEGNIVVIDLDNISTDQIYPGKYVNLTDPAEIAGHVLEGVDDHFKARIGSQTILVVGKNFGCGSSREQAVITLKESGIKAVVASSAARIWYRNAINLALPVMICPDFVKQVKDGEALTIAFEKGEIHNTSTGNVYQGEPVSEFILDIFKNGGTKPMMRKKYGSDNLRNQ
jgi:3-isopropylmalate/(R)-2-methylmalate dehydratase small subunit